MPADSRQAGDEKKEGVPQIEVTPEMIEAGIQVYLEWCPNSGTGDRVDRKMIVEIFGAMVCANPTRQAHST